MLEMLCRIKDLIFYDTMWMMFKSDRLIRMRCKIFLFSCLMILCFAGCNYIKKKFRPDETILARVHDDYLYSSDIKGIVPEGTPREDSILIVKNFIENWVRNRVELHHAEKNLSADEKNFKEQLDDYRNSLIIYTYESHLIRQKLDTMVSIEEIEDYYRKNKQNFVLREPIVKMIYVKISKDSLRAAQLARKFLQPDTILDYDAFERFCLTRTSDYYISINNWFLFRDLQNMAPITTFNEELFLKNNRLIDLTDDQWRYLVRIYAYVTKDGISPLSMEMENIKNILLNTRKQELIRNMRENLYEKALKSDDIEFY